MAALALLPAPASATHLTNSASNADVPWGFNEDWGWGRKEFWASVADRQLRFAGQVMPDGQSANRFHVQWATVEQRRGRYRWAKTDLVYDAMRRYSGAAGDGALQRAGVVARPRAACHGAAECAFPPRAEHLDAWRRFVRRAVERYPDVRAIEVWNEPNLSRFWAPRPTPSATPSSSPRPTTPSTRPARPPRS